MLQACWRLVCILFYSRRLRLPLLASRAWAQVASVCPSDDVCFKLNIPDSTASSGDGDIFFQISAPSDYEWVALGQGDSMSGSNIFVVYTASDSNVTVSPRLGTGHQMPNFNGDAQVTLLEGSSVSGGKMTANVKCRYSQVSIENIADRDAGSNCNSWSGGTADFTSGSGNWIYAYKSSGGPKDSTDQSASISQHNERDAFSWDYASAKGGSSANPLVNSAPSGTGTGSGGASVTSCVPRPTSTGSGSGSASGSGSGTPTTATDDDDTQTQTLPPWATGTGRRFGPPRESKLPVTRVVKRFLTFL